MATRVISRKDLVGLQALSFIRPQTIQFQVANAKPNTRLYAFFDGVSIESYLNTPIITSSAGSFSGSFTIPANTFNTGSRSFRVQELNAYDAVALAGAAVGGASATFSANGVKQTWQQTVTTINEIQVIIPEPPRWLDGPGGDSGDPLAQSFFTYGITGGCFVTSVDIFFATKDSNIPCTLQLREMVNGYPSEKLVSEHSSTTLAPASVNVSSNSTVSTRFTFSRPIYLKENGEYCFVLLANSNKYNVWTSKFGSKAIETGKTIFEQPYIGSLFKSENNITWSAEQTEDIKFTINKAVFGSSASVTSRVRSPVMPFYGTWMSVVNTSAVVTVTLPFQHAFNTGDKLYLTGSSGTNTYRGITNTNLTNPLGYSVTVVNDYSFTFTAGGTATSTGTLSSTGKLGAIEILSGGSGYSDGVYSLTISAPPSGTTAAATITISGGKAVSINITNAGSGYVAAPTVLTSAMGGGTGISILPVSENIMQSAINIKFQEIAPVLSLIVPDTTSVSSTLKSSTQTPRAIGSAVPIDLGKYINIGKDGILATPGVETDSFGSSASLEYTVNLQTSNPNISPVIDLDQRPRVRVRNFLINDSTNAASETAAGSGTSQARYISQKFSLSTASKGIRVLVNAMSMDTNSFDVYVKTSSSTATTSHESNVWSVMTCNISRDKSSSLTDYRDYEFYLDNLNSFDVYSIKIVLHSTKKYQYPKIANYRAIVLAT